MTGDLVKFGLGVPGGRGRRARGRRRRFPRSRSLPRRSDPPHGARRGGGAGPVSPVRGGFPAWRLQCRRHHRLLDAAVRVADRFARPPVRLLARGRREAEAGREPRGGAGRDGRHRAPAGGAPPGDEPRPGNPGRAVAGADGGRFPRRRPAVVGRDRRAAAHRERERGGAAPGARRRAPPRSGDPRGARCAAVAHRAAVLRRGRGSRRVRRPARGPVRSVGRRAGAAVDAPGPAPAPGNGAQRDGSGLRAGRRGLHGMRHRRRAGPVVRAGRRACG